MALNVADGKVYRTTRILQMHTGLLVLLRSSAQQIKLQS